MGVPYNPAFQFAEWPQGPLNAELPPDSSPNVVINQIEAEFARVATAFGQASQVGMVVVTSISNGATIPVPAGFTRAETRFFAFVKTYVTGSDPGGFQVFSSDTGVVTARPLGTDGVIATGVAIARKGGW